jgi:hypothetical protein
MTSKRRICAFGSSLGLLLWGAPALADDVGAGTIELEVKTPSAAPPEPGVHLEEPPVYGIYYDRREPSFYTGFAPRSQDPARVHLQIGRGNQLRITLVLSDEAIDGYARDLLFRYQTYRELIDSKRITPTQNTAWEDFEQTLGNVRLEEFVAREGELAPAARREGNLELMERLNPGRIFRITMPVDEVVRRWVAQIEPADREAMSRDRRLELVNQMLPARLWVSQLDAKRAAGLRELVRAAPDSEALSDPAALEDFRPRFLAFFGEVSQGHYPVRGDALRFVEFTAVHPIGTFNDYTEFRGAKIPMYPTPGRRALTTHQRTHTVDHIPTKLAYSYFPWIPYMHVGKALHNSFHTLWWPMPSNGSAGPGFLPAAWRKVDRGSRDGEPFENLWLLSRGPMSHGCTHVNGGHISELRQAMPSDTEKLYDIDVFYNRSYDYDVFDIDGDFTPEVMGVKYYIAYSLRKNRPNRLRVRDERHAYYRWLYGGSDIRFDDRDQVWFGEVQDGSFVERTAKVGRVYQGLRLYDVDYQPERIQFYRPRGIEFARELRKVAVEHPFDGVGPPVAASE